jgi:flagellar capping protein FliD
LTGHDDVAASLEQLLESLIKMVGRANKNNDNLKNQIIQMNENIDNLQKRISQLEWIMKGQLKDGPFRNYPTHPHTHTPSEIHDHISVHF